MKDYTFEEIQYFTNKLTSLINDILNSKEDSLLDTRIVHYERYTDYNTYLKGSVNTALFCTGDYFSEYLSHIKNTLEYEPDNHYFAYCSSDKEIIINIVNGNNRSRDKHNIVDISTEEEWFQYSTVYSTEVLVGMYLWNAFKKVHIQDCIIEFSEFLKYLKLTGLNYHE